jgi:ribose-phosphate pyrophosphokinase
LHYYLEYDRILLQFHRFLRLFVALRYIIKRIITESVIMAMRDTEIKIFTGNSNPLLAENICKEIGIKLGASKVTSFSDGECSISIYDTVRGCDVFVIQSTCKPVNDNMMELLILIDAFKRASAGRITAVIPYFGYARQDRKTKPRDPISAKLVANLLMMAGANHVVTIDLHASQIQGFFDIPVDNLMSTNIFADFCKQLVDDRHDEFIVVSPDVGSVSRSRIFAEKLELGLAIVDKRRQRANSSQVMNLIGDVAGKNVLLFDDIVDTAGSLCNAAEALKYIGGAKDIYACVSHGVLSGPAIDRINKSCLKNLVLLDTIPYPSDKKCDKITYLSVASLMAEAIQRIHDEISISSLFYNS